MKFESDLDLTGNKLTKFKVDSPITIQGITGTTIWDGSRPQTINIAGNRGQDGAQGLTGAQGLRGVVGYKGVQGITGSRGLQGIQGAGGHDGQVGAQGPSGSNGSNGAQGAQGPKGSQGAQGIQASVQNITYTNPEKMPAAVGGLMAGTSFNKMPLDNLLTKLLYPYVDPTVELTGIDDAYNYELGSNVQSWLTINVIKGQANIASVNLFKLHVDKYTDTVDKETSSDVTTSAISNLAPNGGRIQAEMNTNQNTRYKLQVTTVDGKANISVYTPYIWFFNPIFAGVCTELTQAQIANYSNSVCQPYVNLRYDVENALTNQMFFIAYPPGYDVTEVEDQDGQNVIGEYTTKPGGINLRLNNGTTLLYSLMYTQKLSPPKGWSRTYRGTPLLAGIV